MATKTKILKNKRVLILSADAVPYMPQTRSAVKTFELGKSINQAGGQTRIFIPRYGSINERRHQLHEVIRLSGMNLVVNDYDFPLYIKVASIPKLRMQVYFIDSDDYFKREGYLKDSMGRYFADNDERMIFFTKGVIETVKKLNWAPSFIHLHGWFTSLFPLYLNTYYKNELLFTESKIITSVYSNEFTGTFAENFHDKLKFDGVSSDYVTSDGPVSERDLVRMAISYSDGIVLADKDIDEKTLEVVKSQNKPYLDFDRADKDSEVVEFLDKEFS